MRADVSEAVPQSRPASVWPRDPRSMLLLAMLLLGGSSGGAAVSRILQGEPQHNAAQAQLETQLAVLAKGQESISKSVSEIQTELRARDARDRATSEAVAVIQSRLPPQKTR